MPKFDLQAKIGLFIGIIGLLVAVTNFFDSLRTESVVEAMLSLSVWSMFLVGGVLIATAFLDFSVSRGFQVFAAAAVGSIGIIDVYNSVHGYGVLLMAILLAYKYGFFDRHRRAKIILTAGYTAVITFISTLLDGLEGGLMYSVNSILYLGFFVICFYVILQDEIRMYIRRDQARLSYIERLMEEKAQIEERIREYEERHQPVDLDDFDLTDYEKEILRVLKLTQESNKWIAGYFRKSEPAVSQAIHRICRKMDVRTKGELMVLLRENWVGETLEGYDPDEEV